MSGKSQVLVAGFIKFATQMLGSKVEGIFWFKPSWMLEWDTMSCTYFPCTLEKLGIGFVHNVFPGLGAAWFGFVCENVFSVTIF